MESNACPVCTLFLREGISLEEHLETHPKDQVIEALVNSLRNRDSETQHTSTTNGYTMQALPARSTQYYELPSLPIQSYQSNTIAYQQILPHTSVPPISPSPYVPVTMFMATSGSSRPSQPALMQMVCNPYNVMQMQQQQPVQLVTQRPSGQSQTSTILQKQTTVIPKPTTTVPKTIVSPSSSRSSTQHMSTSSVTKAIQRQISTGVSSISHIYTNTTHSSIAVEGSPVNNHTENVQSPQSSNETRTTSVTTVSNALGSPLNRSSNSDLHRVPLEHQTEDQNSVVIPKVLPILRTPHSEATLINPGLTNRVRVIRVLPPSDNLQCLDTKLCKTASSLPSDNSHINPLPMIFPPSKMIGFSHSHSSTESGETYKSHVPKGSLQSVRSEICDLMTCNKDESPLQEPEFIDIPSFDNSSIDSVSYRVNFSRSCHTSSLDMRVLEEDNSNSSNQQSSKNKISDLCDRQLDKDSSISPKPMDIELSRINLADLGNKPCSSNSKVYDKNSSPVNSPPANLDEIGSDTPTSPPILNPKSPTLRVRTDLSKVSSPRSNDEEDVSVIHEKNEDRSSHVRRNSTSLSPQKQQSQSSIPSGEAGCSNNPDSPRRNQISGNSDVCSGSKSPGHQSDSGSCSSTTSRKSASPGLRIRTDLSSVSVSKKCMKRRDRRLNTQHMLSQLDSNEVTAVLGMVRSSLEIQLPPECAIDCDEYITSDCNYDAVDEVSNKMAEQESSTNEPKTEVDGSPVKNKSVFPNSQQSNTSEGVSYESSSPVNIIEIDGIHIIVPRQFYDEQNEVAAGESAINATPLIDQPETRRESHVEITALQNVSMCNDRLATQRDYSKKNDDNEVSTSYDLLARESWVASDGSDTEMNADCNTSTPAWEEVSEKRSPRYGKGKAGRAYKCITCGETFNCPKERRVHCSIHHSDKVSPVVIPVPPSEVAKRTEQVREEVRIHTQKRQSLSKPILKKVKKQRKPCEVLFVRNAAAKFMGVFVKDNGDENKMQAEGNDEINSVNEKAPEEETPETKKDIKVPPTEFEEDKKEEKSVVKVERRVQCMTCNESFPSKKYLQQHVRLTHNNGEWKHMCDSCQEVFTTELLYNEHLQIHPLECKQCSKNFYRRQNLLVHMKRHLGIKPYKCNMCEKAFVTKQKLNEHQNSHTGATPIKCPLCPMSFRRYSNLIQHKNRLHYKIKKKVKDFVCFCGEIFHSRKKLDWHKEIHDDKPKCCPSCSERFVHSASLTRHIRRAHDRRYMPKVGRENENVECTVCGHVFLKSSLMVHMRLHSGEKPYSCAVCGKNFATKWNLQQHRWVHASRSSKPFKCTLCKGAFSREGDYTQHMDSHKNKRPYTCNVCGEQFVRKPNCLRHMKEHENGKAFFCNECGKSFHRGYYLKDHMRVHTGVRPHVCHICGKASSTKSNHNKHVKIHHAREPVNTES